MLINPSRGERFDTQAVVASLQSGQIGCPALGVYEQKEGLFFEALSDCIIQDDTCSRRLTFPNVLITTCPPFFVHEAMIHNALTTLENITAFKATRSCANELKLDHILRTTSTIPTGQLRGDSASCGGV